MCCLCCFTNKKVDEDSEGFIENNDSQFRDGLLEILLKPYDFTEYARLQIESRSYLRMHDGKFVTVHTFSQAFQMPFFFFLGGGMSFY